MTARAKRPMELVYKETTGPFPASLGGSLYVLIFYGQCPLSPPALPRHPRQECAHFLVVVKRFFADMGVPRAFPPYTPQQNGPVESALGRAYKEGHAVRLKVSNIYQDIHLEDVKGLTDTVATSLWMESLLRASECFNRTATVGNDGWISPHESFYGSRPSLPLLPFFQPAYHQVPSQRKSDSRDRPYYFLHFGYNHGRNCHKLLDAETGNIVFSRDVVRRYPEAPLILPASAVGNPPAVPPEDISVPMSMSVPIVAAPGPAPVPPAPAPAPTPTPVPTPAPTSASTTPTPPTMSQHPAPIPPRVGREVQHEGHEELPGQTRG